MGLSAPRNIFGIHSILFYRLSNRLPYGPILKVLSSGGVDLPADFEDLTGGSERFILASEPKQITPEMKVTTKDFRDFLYEIFMGASVTAHGGDALGNMSVATNVKGTSVIDPVIGIASNTILATLEADLKFGKVVIEAITATTVNLRYSSDIDLMRGTDGAYQNDQLEILAVDAVIALASDTDIAGHGIRLTGGSGAIAMIPGDTAEFDIRPINTEASTIDIGGSGTEFPEFGAIIYAQKRGSEEMFEIECFRCIGAGFPQNLEEKTFSSAELTIKVLKDFKRDLVMRIRHIGFEAC